MDINLLRSLVTVAAFAAFVGIVWWAYAPARKPRFERDALLPFEDDPSPQPAAGGAGSVGLADGCDPKAGYGGPMNPQAHVCLYGRIPIQDMGPLLLASAHPLPSGEGKLRREMTSRSFPNEWTERQ